MIMQSPGRRGLTIGTLVLLAACAASPDDRTETASRAATPELAAPVQRDASGVCHARETIPAVYEHVIGEVQVVQAQIAADGTVLHPPIYRRAPVPRIVRARSEFRFEAPCPEVQTQEFIASVQRALAVRGYFAGNVTGQLDAPTAAALRKYQSERGLESSQISLETARSLGLVAVDRETL